MTTVSKPELFDALAMYGYPLMKPSRRSEPEVVLESLMRQHEGRLLEGFSVVLLSALREKASLRWELRRWDPEREFGSVGLRRFTQLLAISYLLFKLFGVEETLQDRVLDLLRKCKGGEQTLKDLVSEFEKSESIAMNGVVLSAHRLKNTFRTYYVDTPNKREENEKTRALELELLLSELFTPRQKELIRKMTEHAEMTNSEKTYFYGTVRKRLKALADEEVHALARRLVRK